MYNAIFKAKVALAALKENKTTLQLAQEFKINPTQINRWKAIATQEISSLFEEACKKKSDPDVDIDALYAKIGKPQTQLEFVKKNVGLGNSPYAANRG